MTIQKTTVAALGIAALAAASPAVAETPAEFYKGKTVTLIVGSAPGGGYATYAGVLSRHMGRHIPGSPNVVQQMMPGAGSLKATKLLYARSKKDGTVLAAVFMGAIVEPLLGDQGKEYDATKFGYVGSLNRETSMCVSWHTAPVKAFADLFQKDKKLVVGASGWTSSIRQYPTVLKNILGANFEVISGYDGSAGARIAMERGETMGICGLQWSSFATSHRDWIDQKKVNVLVQLATSPHPEMTKLGIPMVWDFVKKPEDREALKLMFAQLDFGRPYIMPPGVPADRLQAMRKAFLDTANDPKFLDEAKRAKIGVDPVSGEEVTKIVLDLYKTTTPELAKRVKDSLGKQPKKKKKSN
jgi:tripartite-type tricarboxylate transporter receptor subunit TctC